ncbi:transaldolase family protein [Planctomicrobium sp. SH664]|uniref:transaldolase family protein n=1 Tax=Planctomicrobium sp. SH664 TaxID=3448125 RepID=UPI003F5C52E5
MTPLASLVACGTKLWLDSIDPDLVRENRAFGATGATSNPIIVSDLIKTGRFDSEITRLAEQGLDDDSLAWALTDKLVKDAQAVFAGVNQETHGDDGYVSFELDPLLEDSTCSLTTEQRAQRYIELGKKWAAGHTNRMIKVPATPGGLAALEELSAAGVTLNVTLIFSERQYQAARDAVWRGAQRRKDRSTLKSVYSIFVSRIDVYTAKHVPDLSAAAQGQVGILNAKRLWQQNAEFWSSKGLPLHQEIIFASTGTKSPSDPKDKYVAALAGSDIQTNPPETNAAVQGLGKTYQRTVDQLPPQSVIDEIDSKVDFQKMEEVLMNEGLEKFANPQKALLALIGEKRAALKSR